MTDLIHTDILRGPTTFTKMTEGTKDDYMQVAKSNAVYGAGLAERVLDHLKLLKSDTGGFAVDRFTHSLQSATRAHRDGRDDEYVVCALLHDLGDSLCTTNHADLAAAVLYPFVSEKNHWIVKHHAIFQGYYFFEHLGLDKNMREQYEDSPHYKDCIEFCARYDMNCFDPEYETLALEHFAPMVHKLFEAPVRSIYRAGSGGTPSP